jgi:hypothetical protein
MNFPNRFQTGLNPPLNRLKLVLNRFETGFLDSKYMFEVLTRQPVLCDNKQTLNLFLEGEQTRANPNITNFGPYRKITANANANEDAKT